MIARNVDELHGENNLTKETQLTEKGGVDWEDRLSYGGMTAMAERMMK